VGRTSTVSLLLAVEVGALSLLLSCGFGHPPQRLTLRVGPQFSGTVRIDTCVPAAPAAELLADSRGGAETSSCPSSDEPVELVVLRGDQRYKIHAENVVIERTGDGIPTYIEAEFRP
jgi:hypothetical protein